MSIKALFCTAGPTYRWKKVMLILLISTGVISGSGLGGLFFYRYTKRMQSLYATAHIEAIIQTSPAYPSLPTSYLAEILHLSVDQPANLDRYSPTKGEAALLATGVIKKVTIKKIKPDVLLIDYVARNPYFFLDDYTNTAVDQEGFFFPYTPFYSPKTLPRLRLGELAPTSPWGQQLELKYLRQVNFLIDKLGLENIACIDLSHMEATSAGKQELVILLKNKTILRINPKNRDKQITYYSIFSNKHFNNGEQDMIIDLRLTDLAFLLNP